MFKSAPRYLSGVSVFYGDDITRREIDGEVVFVLGQAERGPKVPLALRNIDLASPIYGSNNPLTKALYQFWDGYIDSPMDQTLKVVTMRVGGIAASLAIEAKGIDFETVDAYDSIENDFYFYAIKDTSQSNNNLKIWNKNKQLIYDFKNNIDAGYVKVNIPPTSFTTTGSWTVGVDIDNDAATPVSMASYVATNSLDVLYTGSDTDLVITQSLYTGEPSQYAVSINENDTSIVCNITEGNKSSLKVYKGTVLALTHTTAGKCFVTVSSVDTSTSGKVTFNLESAIGTTQFDAITDLSTIQLKQVTAIFKAGSSQLNISQREKYELFRNALAEIEQFTPDWLVPGGVTFDESTLKWTTDTKRTPIVLAYNTTPTSIKVDAAANWPDYGIMYVESSTLYHDALRYTSKTVSGSDYIITLSTGVDTNFPTYVTAAQGLYNTNAAGLTKLSIKKDASNYSFDNLLDKGRVTVGGNTYTYDGVTKVTVSSVDYAVLNIVGGAITTGGHANDLAVARVVTAAGAQDITNGRMAYVNMPGYWANTGLGIGYVQETDVNGEYIFTWSDTATKGYGLAHFGYLFASFCNKAAIEYNTPLCGMNVGLPSSYDRIGLYGWIGKYPTYDIMTGIADPASISPQIQSVLGQGVGLLGNPVLAGSPTYNRSNLSDINGGVYADPAYGLLLTDNDYIDGNVEMDTFSKVVDLGKFMLVGAGLLTFNHKGANYSYIDTCGIYSLGMLAGTPKNQGLSFRKIGQRSKTSVGVIVHRRYYNDLANLGYIVLTREKGLGWVINNGHSVARNDSGYFLISTTRTIKTIVESKRALLTNFINKPLNDYYYEAAKTKLAESFKKDVQNGYINGYSFDLQAEETPGQAIGKLYLKIAINPPFEITQIVIDTVIDRSITSV